MQRPVMSPRGLTDLRVAVVLACAGCLDPSSSPRPTPMPTGSVTDVEGNVYPTIVIGKQEWMVQNLKTATYNDGTAIPNVTDADTWANLSLSGAYAWYGNDAANKDLYGALYNWFAVDTKKLCPMGWAMPSTGNWRALADFLGGVGVAGGAMKEPGTVHWQAPNAGATNRSGFTALPSGRRYLDGSFDGMGRYALWWTSEDVLISLPPDARFADATYDLTSSSPDGEAQVTNGHAIRCFRAAP